MDRFNNNELITATKWTRLGVVKGTTTELNNLNSDIKIKGLVMYDTSLKELFYSSDSGSNFNLKAVYGETGSMEIYSGKVDKIPETWKLCNGQLLSKTEYKRLFDIIGITYGGTTNEFALPDMRDRFLRGADSNGDTGGEHSVTLTVAQMPSHTHSYAHATSRRGGGSPSGSSGVRGNRDTNSVGEDSAHENRPPYIKLYYIIKVR